ncbi:MAG: hypothetical protein ACRDD7_08510 [Peptostreptococcaceae bacterium]
MALQEIKDTVPTLKEMDNKDAYDEGLILLRALKQYRNEIDRREYKTIENAIQDERFR